MRSALIGLFVIVPISPDEPDYLHQPPNTWLKRSPLPGGPISPGMGYEASFGYDPKHKVIIRWAGHNQGGGGEQNAETWTYEPLTAKWTLKEPNLSPPGVCCAQQNVFDTEQNRFIRFQAFSGSHGWQWFREIYLNNSTVWSYDLERNTWRDMRPVPTPRVSPLRCASWDSRYNVVVVFGGEGSTEGTLIYDPYSNIWTRKNPKVQPAFRSSGNMAYDAENKLHILFGAQFSDDPHTWAYDIRKNEWRDMKPAVQPPTDKNDAVLVYDSVNKVIVASVRDGEKGKFETWTYHTKANTWKKMNPPEEPLGSGNRRRIMAFVPDQNVVVMENFADVGKSGSTTQREQQMWTYRYAEDKRRGAEMRREIPRNQPRIVEDVIASVVSAKEVHLSWPAGPADIVGYQIERAVVDVLSEDQIVRLKKDTPPLMEPSVGALRAIGEFERLTKQPIKATSFTDTTIDLSQRAEIPGKPAWIRNFAKDQLDEKGKPYRHSVYAYRVRAVNKLGAESGPGPYALTIPSSPQWFFSKEDGTSCHLKWAANAEKNLKGYRIYRMESPRINGPGQPVTRLTAEPVSDPKFTDSTAGKVTRRYWVVAVDALGQEGYPSAPVWFERQYKKYYVPFVSKWHQ